MGNPNSLIPDPARRYDLLYASATGKPLQSALARYYGNGVRLNSNIKTRQQLLEHVSNLIDFDCEIMPSRKKTLSDAIYAFSNQNSNTPIYHVVERIRNSKGETCAIRSVLAKENIFSKFSISKLLKFIK